MIFTNSYAANSWDSVAKSQEKGFFDFEFITWMAWTWQTAAFFLFIVLCFVVMILWEEFLLVTIGVSKLQGDKPFLGDKIWR